ncbi:uncharacterized protein TOL2_C39930 [Desulfobacula toluolica Tol2]|uniref:Uncharacterized protein n=1 Tax=Desulfobacula toluolica (strain DSM 7467 / Tol2) TaxID=651182 RepID=K0NPS8_DESTT|nr:uncharacterized protein TOL2_C39930 [Desulfobacula toluolica Tol2]
MGSWINEIRLLLLSFDQPFEKRVYMRSTYNYPKFIKSVVLNKKNSFGIFKVRKKTIFTAYRLKAIL